MDDAKLIILVQQYEELYDLRNSNYSNQQRRKNIWDEIGKVIKQNGNACRERWSRIRENYKKALRLRTTKSGQGASNLKKPKFSNELKFLQPYLNDEESRSSNISSPQSAIESNGDSEHDIEINDTFTQWYSENEKLNRTPVDTSKSTSPPATNKITIGRKRVSNSHKSLVENPSAAIVLQNYLDTKTSCMVPKEDTITSFFLSMAGTVKTFPVTDQVEIKRKVFQLINDVESRIAVSMSSATTSALRLPFRSSDDYQSTHVPSQQPHSLSRSDVQSLNETFLEQQQNFIPSHSLQNIPENQLVGYNYDDSSSIGTDAESYEVPF